MDPIKKNIVPIGLGAAGLYGLNALGKGKGTGFLSNILEGGKRILGTNNPLSKDGTVGSTLGGLLSNPNFLIPAAGLISGAFAKKDDPGYTGQGTGLNLQDIAKVANITDEKQGAAVGLNFLPEASARKYSPAEMAATYAAGSAQGGRIGYQDGGSHKSWLTSKGYKDMMQGMSSDQITQLYDSVKGTWSKAQGGRIGAEEGGLMSLGGNEMDLRGGGFVPIGEYEKKDDVPARLSKNEFVFTADAVRAAGGGNVDAGADKMYNTMKQLEGRVG